MKRLLSLGIFALSLAAGGAEAAQVVVRFGAPAPPREFVTIRPGPRYVWIPGHYQWVRNRHSWVKGHGVAPPRSGAVWVPGYWTPRRGGYVWITGYWR